jgi:predicted ATPase/class 3 adenylate cyclase
MLPSGTVTFLFTDIENSTQLWENHAEAMKIALAKHDLILREVVEANHGQVIKTTGDGLHAVFTTSLEAVSAAIAAQRYFQSQSSPLEVKVRIGVHTGEAELRDGDYFGRDLNRAARIMSVAHGGQILLSATTTGLVREQISQDMELIDLGEHRLKGLSNPEHLWQVGAPGLSVRFPALTSLTTFPNNLPVQLTTFVGREKEIAEIKALLDSSRLVTLTGPDGTGKTRLSIQVGSEVLTAFAKGVWLIELAPLVDPGQIMPALAQTFGLQEMPLMPLDALVGDYLRGKQLLLLLDNCEHLIEGCARLADDLLHQCTQLKILTSSREALGIAGETAYRIPSLASAESIQLFVDRARAVNPKFDLSDASAPAVSRICARLDGIPLAIELAAARTKLLSPEQIAQRLDDRFHLLVGGSRTAVPRQHTLRALIDWSYDLLSEEEKRLLRSLSVFAGGWTLDAAEAVAEDADVLDPLEQLVNKSLVMVEACENEMRYSLLETIRQYAREKLLDAGEAAVVRDRHFAIFDGLSEQMWAAFRSPELIAWRARMEAEVDNFQAALDWGMEHQVERCLHLAANFCFVSSFIGMQTKARAYVKSVLERARALPPVEGQAAVDRQKNIARALFAEGMASLGQGDALYATQVFQEAAAISRLTGDKLILGYSLEMFFIAADFSKSPGGVEAAEEGLAALEDQHDPWGLFMADLNMFRVATMRGDSAARQAYLEKIQAMVHQAPLSFQTGMFFFGMGMTERDQGNYQGATAYFEEGYKIFKKLRNKNFENALLSELGHLARLGGDLQQAAEIYRQTLAGWQDLGHRAAIAHQLECFAFIAIAEARFQRAGILLGAAQGLREQILSPMTDFERKNYDQEMAKLRAALNENDFNTFWNEGQQLSMPAAIELALT